jgi:hypothetical protein
MRQDNKTRERHLERDVKDKRQKKKENRARQEKDKMKDKDEARKEGKRHQTPHTRALSRSNR